MNYFYIMNKPELTKVKMNNHENKKHKFLKPLKNSIISKDY